MRKRQTYQGKTSPQGAIRGVVNQLAADDLHGRRAALDRLQRIGKDAVPALLVVLNTGDLAVREAAAWALGEIGDETAVLGLIHALENERTPMVTEAISWSLQMLGDDRAVPALLNKVCDSGTNQMLRDACADALGQLAQPAHVPLLEHAMHSACPHTRQAAAWAMSRIGLHATHDEVEQDIIPALINATGDADPQVRWAGVNGIHELSLHDTTVAVEAVPALIDLLNDCFRSPWGENLRTCDVAAMALTLIRTPQALQAVRRWQQ